MLGATEWVEEAARRERGAKELFFWERRNAERGWVERFLGSEGARGVGSRRVCCCRQMLESQQPQGHGGAGSHVPAAGCGDVFGTSKAKQADGEVAKRGEHLGTVAFAHLRSVLVEGDVAHPVKAVFDGPVAPGEFEELGRGGFLGASRGNAADHFVMGLGGGAFVTDPFDLEDLGAVGERDVAVQFGAGPDPAGLVAAVTVVKRFVLRGGKSANPRVLCPLEGWVDCP